MCSGRVYVVVKVCVLVGMFSNRGMCSGRDVCNGMYGHMYW